MNKRCCFCRKTKDLEKHHIIPKSIDRFRRKKGKIYICRNCHTQLHILLDPVIDYMMLYIKTLAERKAENTVGPIGFVRTNNLKGDEKK